MSGFVLIAPRVSASWCTQGYLAYAPTSGYAGGNVTFTFTFQNLINATVQVSNFTVWYSWGAVSSFGSAVIGPNGSVTRTTTETLPSTPGAQNLSAAITGQASTDPHPIVCSFGPYAFAVATPPPPTLSIAAAPLRGDAPLNVSFTSQVAGGTAPYTYAWTFGDGGSSSVPDPSHVYAAAGTYSAVLVVADSTGSRRSASLNITVDAVLSLSVGVLPGSGGVPLTTSFNATVSGGTPPYTFRWKFGDGNTSSAANTNHTYDRPGTYNATLTVTDSAGGVAIRSLQIVVAAAGGTGGGPGPGDVLGSSPWILPATVAAIGAGGAFTIYYLRSRKGKAPAPPPKFSR